MGKRTVLIGVLALGAVATLWGGHAEAAGPYRRWTTPKPYTCATAGPGVQIQIGDQHVEFGGGLLATSQYTTRVLSNGVQTSVTGPLTVEQTTGTANYPALTVDLPAYPATVDLITETLVNGTSVYSSTISIACAADGSGSAFAVNESTNPDPYRRWAPSQAYTCTTLGDSTVQIQITDQNLEFNELAADDQFTVTSTKNGAASTVGPSIVEQTSGIRSAGALTTVFPSYPVTFGVQIDTIVGGTTVYRSTLTVACSQDSSGSTTAVNAVVTASTTTSTTTSTTITPTTSTTIAPTTSTTTSSTTPPNSTTTSIAAGAVTTTTVPRSTTTVRPTTTVRRTTTTVRRHPATGTATGPTLSLAVLLIGMGFTLAWASRRRPS